MSLRKIRIAHHRLVQLFERTRAIVLTPVKKAQARVDLGIIGFQLEGFLISRNRTRGSILTLIGDAKIVVTGRQFWALVDRLLKKSQRIVQLLTLERFDALQDKQF